MTSNFSPLSLSPKKNSDILAAPLNTPLVERRDINADEGAAKMSGFVVTLDFSMLKIFLATGFCSLSFMFPLKVSAQNYDEIYVFGDALSDTGNVFNATTLPPSPFYQGHFSNGPLWVEYLALDLGLTPNQATNFAFGGASTGFDNIIAADLPGLQQQINSFTAANKSADPNALYIVWAGVDDYFKYVLEGATNPNPTETVVKNLSTVVTSLAAVGAKDIMVVNLPDLGELPGPRRDRQISRSLNALTSLHNSELTASLDSLSQELSPNGVNIIPFDVNSQFNKFFAEPGKFGFTNVTGSCIGDSVLPGLFPGPGQPDACNTNANQFLFWDNVLPTTATHKLLGDFAFSTLEAQSVPEPSTEAGVLALGALGAVAVYKRRLSCKNSLRTKVPEQSKPRS